MYFSRACAIGLRDTVVVTGGTLATGGMWRPGAKVQVYSLDGAQERLPDMNNARDDHACGHYVKDDRMVNHNILCLGNHTVFRDQITACDCMNLRLRYTTTDRPTIDNLPSGSFWVLLGPSGPYLALLSLT